jgi:nucleotide-binding universal stress UspA family protein
VDGSELSETAVPAAAGLAASLSADLVLVRVAPGDSTKEDDVAHVDYLNGVASHYPRQPVQVDLLHDGDTARGIARYAGGSGETIVALATHGRGALGRLVLGSVARSVAHRASCPVLLVPARG